MARYSVKKAFLRPVGEANLRVEVGEEISFDGSPGRGLEPIDADAELAARRARSGAGVGSIASNFAEHRRG